MGRIHNLNRKVGRMGLLNLLYLTSMPTEHKNKYFVKCRYGKYFLCVSKGYKNDLPRSLRSTPFKSPDRALIVCSLYKLFDNKRYKLKLKMLNTLKISMDI
jgi:hypothetical protein